MSVFGRFGLFLDYFERDGLELYDYLEELDWEGSEQIIASYSMCLLQAWTRFIRLTIQKGLAELRRKDLIHCDVKPSNCLWRLEPSFVAVLADFGLSRTYAEVLEFSCLPNWNHSFGTVNHLAPELLANPNTFNHSIDIWGLGTVLAELVSDLIASSNN